MPDEPKTPHLQMASMQSMLWFCEMVAHHNVTSASEADRAVATFGMSSDEGKDVAASFFALHFAQFGKFAFETSSGRMGFAWHKLPADSMVVYVPHSRLLSVLSADGSRFLSPAWIPELMGDFLATSLSEDEGDWNMFYLS